MNKTECAFYTDKENKIRCTNSVDFYIKIEKHGNIPICKECIKRLEEEGVIDVIQEH